MGILKRFKEIMSANINALLDKAEDPVKMIDQYTRDLQSDLGKVKAETATVMAEEARAKRALDENEAEIAKMERFAEKALLAGNEQDAKSFLAKKAEFEQKRATLNSLYESAAANAAQMREMHDKLEKDIASLEERKRAIKAKMAVAKTQEKMNEIGASYNNAQSGMAAFDRMEEKANQMLDMANAKAQLNQKPAKDNIEDLESKYDDVSDAGGAAVDAELAAMKQKLGLE